MFYDVMFPIVAKLSKLLKSWKVARLRKWWTCQFHTLRTLVICPVGPSHRSNNGGREGVKQMATTCNCDLVPETTMKHWWNITGVCWPKAEDGLSDEFLSAFDGFYVVPAWNAARSGTQKFWPQTRRRTDGLTHPVTPAQPILKCSMPMSCRTWFVLKSHISKWGDWTGIDLNDLEWTNRWQTSLPVVLSSASSIDAPLMLVPLSASEPLLLPAASLLHP